MIARYLLVSLVILAVGARGAHAQGTIGIYGDPNGTIGCHSAQGVGQVYVVYKEGPPIQSIDYALPVPSCFPTMLYFLDSTIPTTTGNLATGLKVDFGQCLSAPIHLATIVLLPDATGPTSECCQWFVQNATAVDCGGGNVSIAFPDAFTLTNEPCVFEPPNTPDPPDGATGVPPALTLDWQYAISPVCPLLGEIQLLFLGTDPNPPVYDPLTLPPYQLVDQNGEPLLVPGTTYYWRVSHHSDAWVGSFAGPVWSFTTAGPVPATETTWGRIKALYRP